MLAGQDGPGGIVFNYFQASCLYGSLALTVILFNGGLKTARARTKAGNPT
jgi:potassium/hydrogen antiporter